VHRLRALRQIFPSHRSTFSPGDNEFLKSLTGLADYLRTFGQLREEAVDAGSVKEYEGIVTRLTRIKGAIANLPVGAYSGEAEHHSGLKPNRIPG
jgi:hypothetical protein